MPACRVPGHADGADARPGRAANRIRDMGFRRALLRCQAPQSADWLLMPPPPRSAPAHAKQNGGPSGLRVTDPPRSDLA